MSIEKIIQEIHKHKSFLITSHVNLEGDALGSALGFMFFLRALGKKAQVVMEDECPGEYRFLPGTETLRRPRDIKHIRFDSFAALDCSDLNRCVGVSELIPPDKIAINIDHHISNNNFAKANWVDPKASSACEMVYHLFKRMRLPVSREVALCLYTGILTDTGSFHHPNTTSITHKVASELLRRGVDSSVVYSNIYQSIAFSDILVLIKAVNSVEFDEKNGIVHFSVKRDFLKRQKVSFDLTEQILNFGRMIRDARAVVLFKENLDKPGQVRVNLRSRKNVDISKVARVFGGGGHKNASAATVHGELAQIRKKVLKEIIRNLNP